MTYPDVSSLPTNVDATYVDDPANPSRKVHQQHHDLVHAAVKAVPSNFLTPAQGNTAYVRQVGGDTITASGAAVIPLVVRGATGQTANLLEARNSAGTVLANVAASGTVFAAAGLQATGVGGVSQAAILLTGDPNLQGLIVKGAASQTANLAEFQNSAGTVLAGVTGAGRFLFAQAPAATATAGVNGAPPAQVGGYVTVSVQGVDRKIAYYNV